MLKSLTKIRQDNQWATKQVVLGSIPSDRQKNLIMYCFNKRVKQRIHQMNKRFLRKRL